MPQLLKKSPGRKPGVSDRYGMRLQTRFSTQGFAGSNRSGTELKEVLGGYTKIPITPYNFL
jgi:hypothetical protein